MKKHLLLWVVLSITVLDVSAQTTLYFNDFESYTVGGKIAQQAGNPWTTWSGAPGGGEDPAISSTQAYSGTKSVYVVNNNDGVFLLNDKTSGRFAVSWYMFVETGKLGYFNLLSDFAGSSSKWAFQAFLMNDSIFIDAGGPGAAGVPFVWNSWQLCKLIIDLDDDFATFYLNAAEVISYKWSKGAQGSDNLLKLDAINFYGWNNDGAGTSGYYIDDLKVDTVPAPEPPLSLTATINGADVEVGWTAPSTTPDLYKLSRNGNVVSSTTVTTYTDVSPWPNTYYYKVRAHYNGLGYSHSSNTDSAMIPGGVARNLVLMEEATGTWCQFCPGAAMGLRDLIEINHKDAVAIAYHSGDEYENTVSTARIAYYNVGGYPTVYADGVLTSEGGSATQSMYSTYLTMYNERIASPSFNSINIAITETAPNQYQAEIETEQSYAAYSSGWVVHTALTESDIADVWGNQTDVDFVCRNMYPGPAGTAVDFTAQNPQNLIIDFNTTGFVKDNCEFVVFVQHVPSKLVTQAAMVDMSSVIGMAEKSGERIGIFPNPASDYCILHSNGTGNYAICDISGRVVLSGTILVQQQTIDLTRLTQGVYFVKVEGGKVPLTEKLVIR